MHRTLAEARARFGRLTAARRKGGERIAVARPAVPAAHVAIAQLAVERNDPEILSSVLDEHFTFVGYLAFATKREPYLVDGDGNIIGKLEPGDSLLDEGAVSKLD